MAKIKVVFQGEPGANSHLAIREVHPDALAERTGRRPRFRLRAVKVVVPAVHREGAHSEVAPDLLDRQEQAVVGVGVRLRVRLG